MDKLSQRKSIRLKGWDYADNGFYFVTICTQNKINYFGNIVGVLRAKPVAKPVAKPNNKTMNLNLYGKIVQQILESLPHHHSVCVDIYQIMPNHIHMILVIPHHAGIAQWQRSGTARCAPTYQNITAGSLSCVIRSFKSECTKQIRRLANDNLKIFQRNYYERIIRNEKEYYATKKYIRNNPQNWGRDRNNLDFGNL